MSPVIGIVPHRDRPEAHELARAAAAWLRARGQDVRVPVADAERVGLGEIAASPEEFAAVDVAISVGGDGTMLHTVHLVSGVGPAVLGVNAGQLGYLTEVEPGDLVSALERLIAGEYSVVDRMVLAAAVESDGPGRGKWAALNEIVLEKASPGQTVRLDVAINGAPFTTYVADGLIVATPTGSTAYSFSAGGPIVSPEHECLLLTPVAPHLLFDRALVFGAHEELQFEIAHRPAVLSADGRELGRLDAGDRITCTAGATPARVVTLDGRDFHQILKAKFGLTDR